MKAKKKEILVSIPTEGMPEEVVTAFMNWLRMEATARRSRLTKNATWQLAEDIEADWWKANQARFTRHKG